MDELVDLLNRFEAGEDTRPELENLLFRLFACGDFDKARLTDKQLALVDQICEEEAV